MYMYKEVVVLSEWISRKMAIGLARGAYYYLKDNHLPPTMESVREFLRRKYRRPPDEGVVREVYGILLKIW